MDKLIVNNFTLDEDDFYNISLEFVSDTSNIRCKMYMHNDEIKELKENILQMYNLKLKCFNFKYDAIGLTNNVILNFKMVIKWQYNNSI